MENINFQEIKGPHNSKADNFESLCIQLLQKEFPGAFPLDASKGEGDHGIDLCVGNRQENCKVYQSKYIFSIGETQKGNIRESLTTARVRNPGLKEWVVCLPMEMSPKENTWFDTFKNNNSDIDISSMRREELFELLARYPHIREEFFPEKHDQITREIHDATVGTRMKDRLLFQVEKRNQAGPNGTYLKVDPMSRTKSPWS